MRTDELCDWLYRPQRQHDRNTDGDFLSAVGRQVEDEQREDVDADARDDEIDRVVQDLTPYLQPSFTVDHVRAVPAQA